MGVNSLRSRKLKETIVMLVLPIGFTFVLRVALNFFFNFFFNF